MAAIERASLSSRIACWELQGLRSTRWSMITEPGRHHGAMPWRRPRGKLRGHPRCRACFRQTPLAWQGRGADPSGNGYFPDRVACRDARRSRADPACSGRDCATPTACPADRLRPQSAAKPGHHRINPDNHATHEMQDLDRPFHMRSPAVDISGRWYASTRSTHDTLNRLQHAEAEH